jgi:hypothetical protein
LALPERSLLLKTSAFVNLDKMKKYWLKLLVLLFLGGNLVTCIDPYTPNLHKFESVFVVDALLTDENISNYVKLSKTIRTASDEPEMITDAQVIIKDDLGNSTTLSEKTDGVYRTDSLIFRGEVGRSYTLYIKTEDGKEFKSESCLMTPVQDIDTIYFEKDQNIVNTEATDGIRIFIDSKGESDCAYYRWTYQEWWKFKVPYPQLYDYIDDTTFVPCLPVKQLCWASRKSEDIIIESTLTGASNQFNKKPLLFIASGESDRLLIQYCVQIRQLSILKGEYEFWDKLNQINESGGDIFDKQPFQISGNIHSISNPGEQVLGYFQVSGAKTKRLYITYSEIKELDLPLYKYDCKEITVKPSDFADGLANNPLPTFKMIFSWYDNSETTFTEPVLSASGDLKAMKFAPKLCVDCTLGGKLKGPDFWVDME